MKITFIGHAAILIETKGLRILSDPWWQGPCFGSQWWIYPRPYLAPLKGAPVDYIYISHAHADHLHLGTLRRFPKGTKLLVSSALGLEPHLTKAGYEVIEVDADTEAALGAGVTCRIMPTHSDDTLMVLADGDEVCINANDALHAAPQAVQSRIIGRLKSLYPKIDYVFCGYGIASHFPNCYVIPGKDRAKTAIERQKHFNGQWSGIIAALAPRFGFPFAADVVFLEDDLAWANEPVHNGERPTDRFAATHPGSPVQVVDIAPGFVIEDGSIVQDVRFEPVSAAEIRQVYGEEIARANSHQAVEDDFVDYLRGLLAERLEVCRDYLREYRGDYRFLIRLRGAASGIELRKKGGDLSLALVGPDEAGKKDYDVVLTTQPSYLRRALTNEYGDETLFVGSGCIFEYRSRERAEENLHRELLPLLKFGTTPPNSRFGDQSRQMFLLKRAVKKALGRVEPDLYDLKRWTVFS